MLGKEKKKKNPPACGKFRACVATGLSNRLLPSVS